MDVSLAKKIITPKGSLKRILKGDVIIWEKKDDSPRYGIYKNDVLIEEVTMDDFVSKVRSGYAQTNWGIGAQLRLPYKDPFDNVTYTLPFNLANFKGNTVGLQAHYGIPTKALQFGPYEARDSSDKNNYCRWKNSYIKKWLNDSNGTHGITGAGYKNVKGFLGCLPSDFVSKIKSTTTLGATQRVFLLSAAEYYAKATYTDPNTGSNASGKYTVEPTDNTGTAWTYWINRMKTQQLVHETRAERIYYHIKNRTYTPGIILPVVASIPTHTTKGVIYRFCQKMYYFTGNGRLEYSYPATSTYNYFPACYI